MGDTDQLRDDDTRVDGGMMATVADAESISLPMVEIYETIEGEGSRAGFPTIFVRIFGCNLRCTWCDTPYSYAPAKAEQMMTVEQIVDRVRTFRARHLCLTGGEPLMYGAKSLFLLNQLAELDHIAEIHVETNGAIDLTPFFASVKSAKVRYIMDYKLPDSGEAATMLTGNLGLLRAVDELKFVIGSERDFLAAKQLLAERNCAAQPLFSPVWETMPAAALASLMLQHGLVHVRLSLQLHKWIWGVEARGV